MNTRHQPIGHCFVRPGSRRRVTMRGLSYIEVLIATVLITVALVPAIDALTSGVRAGSMHVDVVEDHYHLVGGLTAVLAEPFADLDAEAVTLNNPATPSVYSDTVTTADGRTLTRQVYLSRYDADNADTDNNVFTDTDAGLLWVKVEFAGTTQALEQLVSIYD